MKVIEPYTPEDFKNYYETRWEILRKPLDLPKGSEIDNNENISLHIMVVSGEIVAGVGRLTYFGNGEGQIRFMGVVEKFRGKGFGKNIVQYLENEAKEMGLKKIFLNARDDALDFYTKMGYKADGKPFKGIAGILHTRMKKKLK